MTNEDAGSDHGGCGWPAELDQALVARVFAEQGIIGGTLNPQQRQACEVMLAGKSLLISGKAGTGKSTTLHVLRAVAVAADKVVKVVAPSGVAAQLVGGRTIHNSFGFDTKVSLERLAEKSEPKQALPVDVLIVDEISMVKADLLDCMDAELRRLKKEPDLPMGGVQVILLGDSLQLPPVHPDADYRDSEDKQAADQQVHDDFFRTYSRVYFDSAKVWPRLVPTLSRVDLERVERVSGDDELVRAFNEVRTGLVTQGSWHLLDDLVSEMDVHTAVGQGWTALAAENKTVDLINARALRDLGMPILDLPWQVEGAVTAAHERDAPFVSDLRLAVGARVMMTVNDAQHRFFNGSFGRVIAANDYELRICLDSLEDPTRPGHELSVDRHTFEVTEMQLRPQPRGPLGPEVMKWQEVVVGEIKQFPVRLAWAITVHRSQGKTLVKCYLENPMKMSGAGQLYVALSRVKSREGLALSDPIDRQRYQPPVERVRQERLQQRRATGVVTPGQGVAFISVTGYGLGAKSRVLSLAVMISRQGRWVWDMQTLICPSGHLGDDALLQGRRLRAYELALAPTIEEVWSHLAPWLQGCQVICANGWMLEFALQRAGIPAGMALGVAVDAGDIGVLPGAIGLADMDAGLVDQTARQRAVEVVAAYHRGEVDWSGGLPVEAGYVDEVRAAAGSPAQGAQLELWPGPTWATGVPAHIAVIDGLEVTQRPVAQRAQVLMERARSRSSWNEWVRQKVVDYLAAESDLAPEEVDGSVPVADEIDLGAVFAAAGAKTKVGVYGYRRWRSLVPMVDKMGLQLVRGEQITKRDCVVVLMDDTSLQSDKVVNWRRMGVPLVDHRLFTRWVFGRYF